MRLAERPLMTRPWRQLPRGTVRFRLTFLYGSLFLAVGAALLAITYVLMRSSYHFSMVDQSVSNAGGGKTIYRVGTNGQLHRISGHGRPDPSELHLLGQLYAQAAATHAHDLHQLLIESIITLAVMAVLAIGLGWIVAGRVLGPLRMMRNATQEITEHNLHRRLAVEGPRDEIKDLADTIDGLLGRLETAFDSQRRFIANASHELRTPLTLERALVEVALANPSATPEDLRVALREVLSSSEHQERLIDALLTLATSERGIDHRQQIDLTAVTDRVLAARRTDAVRKGLQIDEALAPAQVAGDPDLIERLIANLVDNAIRYNLPGGHIEIVTGIWEEHATLLIANTGPTFRSADIGRIFQPYERLAGDRTSHPDGHGLGLSIVHAIATAHGATVEAQPRPGGGLEVQVHFFQASVAAAGQPLRNEKHTKHHADAASDHGRGDGVAEYRGTSRECPRNGVSGLKR